MALIDWSAPQGGERLEGKEVAVYRVRNGKVADASFHQNNPDVDMELCE